MIVKWKQSFAAPSPAVAAGTVLNCDRFLAFHNRYTLLKLLGKLKENRTQKVLIFIVR